MRLSSFFYNTQDLFRSVRRRVLTASGSSVSSLHVRLSCSVHRQVQTPGLACAVRRAKDTSTRCRGVLGRAMPCCHVASLCSSVLFPFALFLSLSLILWLCLFLPFVPLSPPFYIRSHHCGQRCHCCPASTNPFVDFDAWSCFTADIPHTLGWALRFYFVTYIYIITFNFTKDWTPNIP